MVAIQAIYIRGHEERAEPKTHIVYRIDVQASVRSWQIWRRYSEFDDLHTELTKSTGAAPPAPLPAKHSFTSILSRKDPKILEERERGLESYLRAIIGSKDDRWREAYEFKEFLGVPISKKDGVDGGAPSDFTSASWLDEHMDLQNRVRDIRADLNKRDALSERGDIAAAHTTNVQAKKKLAAALNRLGSLATGLNSLAHGGLSEGEIQRRSDMIGRLQDDCEKLSKMIIVARNPGRGLASNIPANQTISSSSERATLFSGAPDKPVGRVFGAPKPVETEQTRPLDNQGVLMLQKSQIEQQDTQLSQLSAVLMRQKQLGIAIGQEISEQIEMLDDLSSEVDNVGTKLSKAKKQLNRVDGTK